MAIKEKTIITVATAINAPIQKVWQSWTQPEHITKWNNASDDWHTPTATNDLKAGGSFVSRMEAKDGSMGFDFGGKYDAIRTHEYIQYTIEDGRKVKINFTVVDDNTTKVSESFEAENTHSPEAEKNGWQSILDNFKRYTESL
jgi:uncharacterized protein YndB with AHSA1/START domain